ncbi:hypothetical protein [Azospirillum rugosum]|uniref:Lipoprotein n=2 Tax=Azospirillum rugosum TaxID=416170 RepID=A0ABS4SWZ7_9PROT|nr:hypothetical protein [Azospirillum rugosum]MBP2296779.1 hypothetical protein [Azospirillum rugosum]MDQ0530382.1 hypothetical protein [Azospirillum rugosum]
MGRLGMVLTAAAAIAAAGCQSQNDVLNDDEAMATQTALRRAQFEMGCQQATGSILSRNLLQPAMWRGLERAEYTVGVSGCDKKAVYVVVCQIGSPSCFAADSRGGQALPP